MPKRSNPDAAKGNPDAAREPERRSTRLQGRTETANPAPKVVKKAPPKRAAKGKKASPAENGDAKAEAAKVEAAADAK